MRTFLKLQIISDNLKRGEMHDNQEKIQKFVLDSINWINIQLNRSHLDLQYCNILITNKLEFSIIRIKLAQNLHFYIYVNWHTRYLRRGGIRALREIEQNMHPWYLYTS